MNRLFSEEEKKENKKEEKKAAKVKDFNFNSDYKKSLLRKCPECGMLVTKQMESCPSCGNKI